MTPLQSLHLAIGELAYSIARADGTIQKEERKMFHDIVASELLFKDYDFDVSDIIFQILDKDKYVDAKTSYDWAMNEIKLNSHYLSHQLKETFLRIVDKVAKAYPPVTNDETTLIDKFKKDIDSIHGDPVYYEQYN